MVVKVVSKIGQAFARSLDSLSLADGSMLLRMRRASFALFALVGAVGLGLIVFIAQLGWPGVVSGPLPGPPTQAGTVHNAIALTEAARSTGAVGPAAIAAGRPARDLPRRGTQGSRAGGRSQLGQGKKLAGATGTGPGQGVTQPPSPAVVPGSPPAASPPASAPTTAAVESPPQSSSADPQKSAANSKTTEASVAKAVSDSSKSATKSQGQRSAVDNGSSSSKASEAASAKAKRDESAAKTKASVPSPVTTPETGAPTAASPAAAKEAADAANSD